MSKYDNVEGVPVFTPTPEQLAEVQRVYNSKRICTADERVKFLVTELDVEDLHEYAADDNVGMLKDLEWLYIVERVAKAG